MKRLTSLPRTALLYALVCTSLTAVTTVTGNAAALSEEEKKSGARTLAGEGKKAFTEGRFADAVDLFTRAESLVSSPVHNLYIGQARAALGQLVEAREALLLVKREPVVAGEPPAIEHARATAREEIEKITARLPYLTIRVEGAGSNPVTVTADGVQVPAALIGVPRPVNPGDRKVQAFAGDLQSEAQTVTLAEGAKQTVTLVLKAVDPAVAAAAPPPAAPATGEDAPAATPANEQHTLGTDDAAGMNPLRLGSYIGFGVGAVGLGLGTYFALDSSSKDDDMVSEFGTKGCRTGASTCDIAAQKKILSIRDERDSSATLATVGFIAGGVGIAAGVTLFVLSMDDDSASASAPTVVPFVGYNSLGVAGRF